ncbi:hypothetical protein FRC12_001186 [Ceratobasidium sp. 428]|nr:hypothetical protein FRC12_001186 [Ceratobasidium sp. 428]
MSVASAPIQMTTASPDDPRTLPPFANLIALSSRAPLHTHSNGYPDTRYALGPVPSSPDRGPKDALRGPNGPRTSPTGLDRVNSTGKSAGGRANGDESVSNDDPDRPKRKRQSQSCDACRARKVRCARENPDDQNSSCKHCQALDIPCTYDYQPKKRGPPNLYLRRLQEAAAANLAAQQAAVVAGNVVQTPNGVAPQTSPHNSAIPPTDGITPPIPVVNAHASHQQQHGIPQMSVPSQPTVPSSVNEQPVHVPMTMSTATSPVMEYNAALSPLPVALPPSRVASYDPPTSMMVVIRYFDTVYHFCEGHDATSHAAFGEAAHIAVTLHMHEETSYEGLDPIECEVRRRTFWLLFGADKSMSILLGRPICLRDEDCTLHFPKEVDDEYITVNGIQPQPHGKTAIVSGLNYISRIFALLGEILVRIRVDKRSPPQGPFATARLEEVRSLHTRICSALMHAPPALRLKPNGGRHGTNGVNYNPISGQQEEYGGAGFRKAAFAEVKDFFDNPNASRVDAMNTYLVMQANLYVTQQLVRYVIEQYRDELVTSMRQSAGDNFESEALRTWTSEDKEQVASDLLNVLHSIPIQSIAVNGPSLVHKVRFVASTLLDAVRKAETAPASAARAHAYLWDFLSILSEIERNYLLDDEQDGMPSDNTGAINV